jgi:hypothetical protein
MSSEGIPKPGKQEEPTEETELPSEQIEEELAQESEKLAGNIEKINTNLDQVDGSSDSRAQKIHEFIQRNYFAIVGGGGIGIMGEGLHTALSGGDTNWGRVAIGLGLGIAAGKALDIGIRKIVEKMRKSQESNKS